MCVISTRGRNLLLKKYINTKHFRSHHFVRDDILKLVRVSSPFIQNNPEISKYIK